MKIARPPKTKWNKEPRRDGTTQVWAMIDDGFPLIGLMHICMPTQALKHEEKTVVKVKPNWLDDTVPGSHPSKDETVEVRFDHFPAVSSEHQMRRMMLLGLPKFVGLKCFGLSRTKDGSYTSYVPYEFHNQYEAAYFNPKKKNATVRAVENLFQTNPDKFVMHHEKDWLATDIIEGGD